MGVYIKGMNMPRNCADCFLEHKCEKYEALLWMEINKPRKSDCPLIEVKEPHGRLIDADAIDTSYSDPEVIETLREAPTVIEVEEKDDEVD